MAIYEMEKDGITQLEKTTFTTAGVRELQDIQRLLKTQIDVICQDVLVIAEGFRDWEGSRRELDLLGVDKNGNLVVIELKRTEDGGFADIQAIRYAAMVSTMTYAKAVEVFATFRSNNKMEGDAGEALLEFLGWPEPNEDKFAQGVRIVLVAAGFSKELTTSVLWLNQRDLDIRCVRMSPYQDGERVLVDVQQVIPLPEAAGFMVQIREKAVRERQDRAGQEHSEGLRREFWQGLWERSIGKTALFDGRDTSSASTSAASGIRACEYQYRIRHQYSLVRFLLWAEKTTNEARFDWLTERRKAVETALAGDGTWEWNRRDDCIRSHITLRIDGGYRSPREEWPAIHDRMVDAMVRLEKAISPHVDALKKVTADALADDRAAGDCVPSG
jgi:Domain of unknown function (DUF4268)